MNLDEEIREIVVEPIAQPVPGQEPVPAAQPMESPAAPEKPVEQPVHAVVRR